MKILGRKFPISLLPRKIWELGALIGPSMDFEEPMSLWRDYIRRPSHERDHYKLRDGTVLYLSENPHDVITVMVNFCKREYGAVATGSSVLDIGANIGMFALFAARCGARSVYSYEPNSYSYSVLIKNIEENGLGSIVKAYQRAVGACTGDSVYLPKTPSPYNRSSSSVGNLRDFDVVQTVSLEDVLDQNDLASVDYLKIDCEGAEYEVFMRCPGRVLERIRRIRMELHYSKEYPREAVLERLAAAGFSIVHSRELIYWLDRT